MNKQIPLTLNDISELQSCRIRPFIKLAANKPMFSYKGVPLMTRGNISGIVGNPKTGKTMILSFLISRFIESELEGENFASDCKHPVVLYFDTEQSTHQSQVSIKRIYNLLGENVERNNIIAYNLRGMDFTKRKALIHEALKIHPDVSLIIIDGIADLLNSYNDEQQASQVIQDLMTITKKYDCHVCVVMHTNKGTSEPKGHLGAFLKQKAENIFLVLKENNTIFFEPQNSRDISPEKMKFNIELNGLPKLLN